MPKNGGPEEVEWIDSVYLLLRGTLMLKKARCKLIAARRNSLAFRIITAAPA